MKLIKKIRKHIITIIKQYRNDKQFSKELAFTRLFGTVASRFNKKISAKFNKKKDDIIIKFIEQLCDDILVAHKKDTYQGIYKEDAPIWVCWWTGLDTAPGIIKQCVKSIEKNAEKYQVNIITQENYSEYLEIPSFIINKVNSGKICIAHFSDYLRISLLKKYGGLWLDATIYVPRLLPNDMFKRSIFTCKSPNAKGYFANGRWTPFCIGGWEQNVFFTVVKKCIERYWTVYDTAIDYLFVDYIFASVYDKIPYCHEELKDIPISNMERNELAEAMVKGIDGDKFDSFIYETTAIYKLSWREKYPTKTKDNKDTVYTHFIKMSI